MKPLRLSCTCPETGLTIECTVDADDFRNEESPEECWASVRKVGIELRKAVAPEKPAEPVPVYRAAVPVELVKKPEPKPEPCGSKQLYFGLSCKREKGHTGDHKSFSFHWSAYDNRTVTHTLAQPAEPELETRPCLARRVPGILNSQEGKCVLPLGHAGAHELGNA